jgi:hypothetical protein
MPVRKRVLVLLVLCWCLFLGIQKGDPFDETEHAHVAWLMGHEHRQPLRDFFQHHQPLLWDVLQLYYRLGGDGAEVRYYGRAVVVACALVVGFCLVRLAGRGRGALGLLPLVALSLLFPALFVARPETLGLACFVLAAVAWMPREAGEPPADPLRGCPQQRSGRRGQAPPFASWLGDLLAGALFGLALLASPRFLLLAGAFVLLPRDSRTLFFRRVRPLARLALATAAVVSAYVLLRGYSLADMRFNLAFSGALAKVGAGYFREAPLLLVAAAGCAGVVVWTGGALRDAPRRRFVVHAVYLVLVLAASLLSTWPYLYPQNLFAPAGWLGLMLAIAERDVDPQLALSRRPLLSAATWAGTAGCLVAAAGNVVLGTTVADRVAQDRGLLLALRPGDRVLLASGLHPVCAPDASYYANPITDAEDRLAEAVRRVRPRWPLPECDYPHDILAAKPALIDGLVLAVLPDGERDAVLRLLRDEYEPLAPEDSDAFRRLPVYRRRS